MKQKIIFDKYTCRMIISISTKYKNIKLTQHTDMTNNTIIHIHIQYTHPV